MATLASLTVNLLAQTGRFTQPVQQAARVVQQFDRQADRMQRTLQRVDSATSAARGRVLALAAAYTVATRQAVAYADGIMAVHKQTGLAVESTQALRYAAQQSYTDIATFDKGMRAFVRRAAEAAEGNASMAKGFARLGVSVVDAEGKLKGTEELLLEVADGAARMRTEADASAALMLVMGDAGRRLVPFMRQGADGIRDLMDEAVRLGIVADEHVVVALSNLGAEATNTSMRFGAISRDLAYRFSPAAQVALGWTNRLIDGFFDLNDEQRQQIVRWTAIVAAVLGGVAVIGVLARVLSGAIGIMRTFGTVLQLVFSPLVLYTALAIGAIALFKTAWDRDWLGIQTRTKAAVDYISKQWDRLTAWWETSDLGQSVRDWWARIDAVWRSDELTFSQKVIETLNLVPGVGALLGFVSAVKVLWSREDLAFGSKVIETMRLIPGFGWLADFSQRVQTIWIDDDLTLKEKAVEIARLIPGVRWLEGFVAGVRVIWAREDLTLGQKVAEIVRLIPGISAIENMIAGIKAVWANEELTLPEKVMETYRVVADTVTLEARDLAFLLGAGLTSAYLLDKIGDAIRMIPGLVAVTSGNNLLRLGIAGLTLGLGIYAWKLFNESEDAGESLKQQAADMIEGLLPTGLAVPLTVAINAIIDSVGGLHAAIKKGLDTGDWSDVFGATADAWRTGANIAVTLMLASGTVSALLSAVAAGFGVSEFGGLGAGGVLATISIAVALMEAHEAGDYTAFGANLIAALAAGIGIGMFTGSPYTGALAFTIVLNFKVGEWIGDKFEQLMDSPTMREIRALAGTGPTREAELLATPQLYGDREAYIGPAPDYTFGQKVRLWWQNTPLGRLLTRDSPIEFPVAITIEDVVGIRGIDDILDAIYVAEGGPAARVPYGATGFADAGNRFAREANQQLFDELVRTLDLVEGTDEYYRAAAAVTVKHYWDTFARDFPELADRTFAELAPDIQAAFIRHLGQFYAPVEAHALNRNWTPNVLAGLGLTGFARGGYTGDAPVDRVVGVVHGQELVVPAPAVRRGLEGILEWLGVPGFQSGTPVMIDSGLGYAVSPGARVDDIGFVRRQVEVALRWVEQSVSPELADMLRTSFESLLDVTDMLERELKVLWEAIDSVPDALDDALASARSFGDELDELLASEQERQDRLQRVASNVNAALSGFASGLDEGNRALAEFVRMWRWDTEQGLTFDWTSLANLAGSFVASLFQGPQAVVPEPRTFDAPDPRITGLLSARKAGEDLEAEITRLERRLSSEKERLRSEESSWWNRTFRQDILNYWRERIRTTEQELASARTAFEGFDVPSFLGIDPGSVAQAVESGFDIADASKLGESLESVIRDALVRAWTTSDEMVRLQQRFGDMLEGIVTEYMETGIVGDLGALRGVIAAIEERGEAFAEVLRELGLAGDELNSSFGGMLNIPRGFRYALERVEASTARAVPASVSPSPAVPVATRDAGVSGGAGLLGRGDVNYVIHGDVYGWDDFKRKVQQAEAEGKMDGSLAQYGFTGGRG